MKKVLSIVLALAMVFSMAYAMTGCKSKNTNVVNAQITDYLVAEKVGTVNRDNFMTAEGGLYYQEEGKFGVMTHEGLYDTGAIYNSCSPRQKYFEVSMVDIKFNDIATVNSKGLVNSRGRVLVPDEYAYIYILNDRFAYVVKAAERTYVEDDSTLCTLHNYTTDEKAMYKGVWYVYDMASGRVVNGVQGTMNAIPLEYGNYLKYRTDNDEYLTVNANGEAVAENVSFFSDGSYKIEGKVGEVYDKNDNKIFSYDLTGFIPSSVIDGGNSYVATKYVDGTTKYVVMDNKGQVVSAEFNEYINVYGKVVHCADKIYNYQGENIIAGNYDSVYYDKMFGQSWIIREDKKYTMIDEKGGVFFAGTEDKAHNVFVSDFVCSEKRDDNSYYYSFKDNGYTIQGYSFAPWIVKTSGPNYTYDLVDTMTGNKLLEGYKTYSYIARNTLAYYVYAEYEGAAEVYLIVSSAQLTDVVTKKNNLLDDLIAAFAAEGITVTIDKETGEMALDSSVLFGGDSAVLTDKGKAFLNKFIKVYTSIAFSEKYEGFITKTLVEGHTAPVAGSTYASGLQLSEERANNVRDYCISKETGVDVSKIANSLEAVGYSNSKPVKDKDGNVNMAASRRVSFRFLVAVDI